MDAFTKAYLAAALWSALDFEGEPLDREYDTSDFAPEALEQAARECKAFRAQAGAMLDDWEDDQAGHDFSLTRNRHGAGFWDRMTEGADGLGRPMPYRDELTTLAHKFGELNVIVGDDSRLYFERA